MARYFKSSTVKALCGLALGGTVVATVSLARANNSENEKIITPLNRVLASYTTNFEPSVKWDYNWDR